MTAYKISDFIMVENFQQLEIIDFQATHDNLCALPKQRKYLKHFDQQVWKMLNFMSSAYRRKCNIYQTFNNKTFSDTSLSESSKTFFQAAKY